MTKATAKAKPSAIKRFLDIMIIPLIFVLIWLGLKWYRTPNYRQGAKAPDFVAYKANGDSLKLSDYEGQYILLDFWGSWCGPCRQSNKWHVKLYKKYKDAVFKKATGFTILSVGIETRKSNWLDAIEQDGLSWSEHVSDLDRFEDHVAELYGVKEIPTTFLIDENRMVAGLKLSEKEIDQWLSERLK